jgi:hypothetical protein
MDHFPVCSLLEEVSSYQKQDFEDYWTFAQEQYSDEINEELFASPPAHFHDLSFDMELANIDPLLSAASLDYDNLIYGPCSPIMDDFSMDEIKVMEPEKSPVKEDQEDKEMDKVFHSDIHNYCTPEDNDVIIYDHDSSKSEGENENRKSSEEENKISNVQIKRVVRRRRQQRRSNKLQNVSTDISDDKAIFSNGKPKLYTVRPFRNPEMERARLNAINAKINRDRKKQEADNMKREMERLKRENNELRKAKSSWVSRASQAEQELEKFKTMLEQTNLVDVLKWSTGKKGSY